MNRIYDTYIPKGFSTVSPYLMVNNPEKLIEFLQKAFFAEIVNKTLDSENLITNAIINIGHTNFMIGRARGEFNNFKTSLYLYVDDVDMLHKRAIENGAELVFEPENMPYNDRQSGIIDPTGNYWWISKRLENKNYEE